MALASATTCCGVSYSSISSFLTFFAWVKAEAQTLRISFSVNDDGSIMPRAAIDAICADVYSLDIVLGVNVGKTDHKMCGRLGSKSWKRPP